MCVSVVCVCQCACVRACVCVCVCVLRERETADTSVTPSISGLPQRLPEVTSPGLSDDSI